MAETAPREIRGAVFAALLAPASALPAVLARTGGSLGWLGAAAALPAALFVVWRLGKTEKDGLAASLRRRGSPGKALAAVYYLWAMGMAAMTMGSCVDRLRRTDYGHWPAWALAAALALVCAYLVTKGREGFLRAAGVFCLALTALVILILILGLPQMRWEELSSGRGDALGALRGTVPVLASLSVGALGAFLPRGEGKAGYGPVWGWCAVAAGLTVMVTGVLGAVVAAHGPLPFFLALQGLGVKGGFQRLEALVTAAWVLSDLTLVGLAALAGAEMAGGSRWAWPVVAAAGVGGALLTNAALEGIAGWSYGINLALGGVIPVVLSLRKPRGERKK